MKYKSADDTVEAIQYHESGSNIREIEDFVSIRPFRLANSLAIRINTAYGAETCFPGDYIVKFGNNEIVAAREHFEKIYKPEETIGYVLKQDDNLDWYVIPLDEESRFDLLLNGCPDTEDEFYELFRLCKIKDLESLVIEKCRKRKC